MSELYKSILSKGSKMDFHLIPMKKTRKKPKTGDVFVVQPIEGVYYYGKVIISKYRSEYEMYNEMPLIYIYDEFSTKIKMPQSLEKILIAPLITNYGPWTHGYFQTVGNIPVSEEEKNLDCGFFSFSYMDKNKNNPFYRNIHGTRIDYVPQFNAPFGLYSYKGVNYELCKALGIE